MEKKVSAEKKMKIANRILSPSENSNGSENSSIFHAATSMNIRNRNIIGFSKGELAQMLDRKKTQKFK